MVPNSYCPAGSSIATQQKCTAGSYCNTTGLSAVACCHPACDAYLNTPSGLTEKQQRSALKAHLAECCKYTIPGFHKCVAQHAAGNTSEVLAKVVNGECLKPPVPSRSFGAAPYESARLALLQRKQQASYRRSLEAYTAGDDSQIIIIIITFESVYGQLLNRHRLQNSQ